MATTWTDELKQKAISQYKEANPTPETSSEIIKEIAEELNQSPNGVRMILVGAGVYVKKDAAATSAKTSKTSSGGTRVSKEDQIGALKALIDEHGLPQNDEILDKLTGKAASYLVDVIKAAVADE